MKLADWLGERRLLLALSLLLIAVRFAGMELAPFLRDEPLLQLRLDEHLREFSLPLFGLMGSYGLPYGPAPLWFYLPFRLLSNDPVALLAYHCLGASFALLLVYRAAAVSALGPLVASRFLLLSAASPFLFFYSRMAWDNTLLVPFSGLVCFALERATRKKRGRDFALLGAAAALCALTHAMAVPVVTAAALLAWSHGLRGLGRQEFWHRSRAALACFLLPFAVYLPTVIFTVLYSSEIHRPGGAALSSTWQSLLGLGQFLSFHGMEYFLDLSAPELYTRFGAAGSLLRFDPGWLLKTALFLSLPILARRFWQGRLPLVTAFALLTGFFTVAFYFVLTPDPIHPHYFIGAWWVAPVLAASLPDLVPKRLSGGARSLLLLVVAWNLAFLAAFYSAVGADAGTRWVHYGTAVGELRRFTRQLCGELLPAAAGQTVYINLAATPGVLGPSLFFLSRHLPECQGLRFNPYEAQTEKPGVQLTLEYGQGARLGYGRTTN